MVAEIIIVSLISLLILFLRKNKFNISDFNIEIKGYKILILMAVIEIAARLLFASKTSSPILRILSNYWLVYTGILIVSLMNIRKDFMKPLFMGTLLNFIAIISNNFKMPVLILNSEKNRVFLQSGQDLIHSLLTDSTQFKILCDIITIPYPYPFVKTISIGDVLLLVGIFIFWQKAFVNNEQSKVQN